MRHSAAGFLAPRDGGKFDPPGFVLNRIPASFTPRLLWLAQDSPPRNQRHLLRPDQPTKVEGQESIEGQWLVSPGGSILNL